ncbi:MAG: preprotein translocase subunit YajC [Deltaproteobacteria bacterium]|jgi:preprotein translocase subunit YajC|nr:preprotein translocase subunit YajC [Deltaproteobacteria bacterium]
MTTMLTYLLTTAAQAWAMAPQQTADGQQSGGGMQLFILMGGFILIFYFLLIRPQKKQQRERQNMLDNIKKGDRVQTNGGLLGVITGVDAKEVTLRIAPEVRVKVARVAIAGVIRVTADSESTAKAKGKDAEADDGEKTDLSKPGDSK